MQLVRFDMDDANWALVDEARGELRYVAGGLTAGGLRIAGGEGAWALPQTGRVRPLGERGSDLRPLLRRFLDLPASTPVAGPRPGDAVVLGPPKVHAPMAAPLSASNLGAETDARDATGSRRSVVTAAAGGWKAVVQA